MKTCLECPSPISDRSTRCRPCARSRVGKNQLGKKRGPQKHKKKPPQPAPEGFVEIAGMQSIKQLCEAFGKGPKVIIRWRRENGITAFRPTPTKLLPKPRIAIPEDFEETARRMTANALKDHYRRSGNTILRWIAETGVTPPAGARKLVQFIRPANNKQYTGDYREDSEAGRAQYDLQRDGWTVYRCNDTGRQSQGGKFWRCGRNIVTDAELIERAERCRRKRAA